MENTEVVDTTSKYIVKSTGIGSETNLGKWLVDAEELTGGTNKSKVSLIECFYLIEGTGTLDIEVGTPAYDGGYTKLSLTGKGKYGLRPVSYTHLTLPTTPYV